MQQRTNGHEVAGATHPLGTADRVSLWGFLGLGAVGAAAAITGSVARIAAVLGNDGIEIPTEVLGATPQTLGAGVSATTEALTLTVNQLPAQAIAPAITGPALMIVGLLGIAVGLGIVSRNVLRGVVFTRTTAIAIGTTWIIALVTFIAQPLLNFMTAVETVAEIDTATGDWAGLTGVTPAVSFSPLPWILFALVGAITAHAFAVGAKLHRETEGLV